MTTVGVKSHRSMHCWNGADLSTVHRCDFGRCLHSLLKIRYHTFLNPFLEATKAWQFLAQQLSCFYVLVVVRWQEWVFLIVFQCFQNRHMCIVHNLYFMFQEVDFATRFLSIIHFQGWSALWLMWFHWFVSWFRHLSCSTWYSFVDTLLSITFLGAFRSVVACPLKVGCSVLQNNFSSTRALVRLFSLICLICLIWLNR